MKYPISPDYVQAAGEQLTPLYQGLEDYIIEKICEQFKTGEANATAIELIRELQRRGLDMREIEKQIKKTLGITQKELDAIFDDAIKRNELYYGDVLDKMGLAGDSYQMEAMRLEAEAIARQTAGTFLNLTQSLGFAMPNMSGQVQFFPIAEAYQNALNRATVRVLSGAEDYNTAVRQAVKELTDSGIQVVDYKSGHHDRADVAARRAIMTGVTQISSKYTEQTAEDVPTPYREVSAHAGARDIDKPNPWSNHKAWQGKVYSIKTGDKYPSIYAVCGWGEVDGLEGANCRHVHYPFWEGISERTYTDEELVNIDPPPFKFEGREYTIYEATQQQRKIERALRAVKRRMIGQKAAGQDYTPAAIKYKRLDEEYEKFNIASGLRSQRERGNIPEFGPKEARQALKTVENRDKMLSEFNAKMNAAGYKTEGFDRYYGDRETLEKMSSSLERMQKTFPNEANGTTIRWGYSKDETEFGWYEKDSESIVFNRKIMGNWNETMKRYAETVRKQESPKGTDAEAVFYHEFGHRVWAYRKGGSLTKPIDKVLYDMGYGHVSAGYRDNLLTQELSSYATIDTSPRYEEALAESFGEWYNSKKPRSFCEMLLKEVGIL